MRSYQSNGFFRVIANKSALEVRSGVRKRYNNPFPSKVNILPDSTKNEPSTNLKQAADACGIIGIPEHCWKDLEAYCQLLWEWNSRMNLTRHTNFDLFARRDLLDSWKLANLLQQGEEVLDVGTGGGVPGIVVAILRPDLQVSLCDSVGKKAKAVEAMAKELKLKIPVHATDVRKVLADFRYDSIVTRAVGPLAKLCRWLDEHWFAFGRLLAIKGPKWIEERGEARHLGLLKNIELRKADAYPMPDTHSESVILQLRKLRPGEKSME
ncbi:MAG: 16S rRNA (guanine(527)-N(7))-methyltransferase RsmG [Pirellulaceae bacterium]|nr:16S rRNA (guanine(527)-N(7))-methyltransferase RsmG [Pirellulaceae bacterium]